MGKLRIFSGQDICKILAKHNFNEVRRRGSHIVMQRRTTKGTTTVPIPNHKEIRIGTLQSIIRQSGLARNKFEV